MRSGDNQTLLLFVVIFVSVLSLSGLPLNNLSLQQRRMMMVDVRMRRRYGRRKRVSSVR